MTVTLAFKAFASSIPCITPFLATSDPSVLKRILAYIRVTPLLVEHFPKCDPCRRSGQTPPSPGSWPGACGSGCSSHWPQGNNQNKIVPPLGGDCLEITAH